MSSLVVAAFCLNAVFAVLTAAGLQFIGLGDQNAQSWGKMLYWSYQQAALQSGQILWALLPGVCIALFGWSLALLNFAFDEIANPALRPVRRLSRRRLARSSLGRPGAGRRRPRTDGERSGEVRRLRSPPARRPPGRRRERRRGSDAVEPAARGAQPLGRLRDGFRAARRGRQRRSRRRRAASFSRSWVSPAAASRR